MILRYAHLSRHERVFKHLTGIAVAEFDALVRDVLPRYRAAEHQRLTRPSRKRAIGAGHPFTLDARDQLLLTIVWLRLYPLHEVLAYLFAISDSTVSRVIARFLPLLEASGRDTMRMPDPGKKRRRTLADLLSDTPNLAVVIDSFEQRVQRPRDYDEQKRYYSGKKRQHTLKSQVTVDEESGRIVDIAERVPGPTPDITLLEGSHLLECLPEGLGALGDLGYVGSNKLHSLAATPRRKPRGKDRPPEAILYNRAFSGRRIVVEHSIGKLRRYQSLSQTDRNHRQDHTARVCAVAGLVNRRIDRHCPC